MTTCQELEELIPAFVLDAVDARERERIEQHIANCAACAQSVAGYRSVTELLPFAAPQVEPPVALKYRVLAAALPHVKPQSTRTRWFAPLMAIISSLFRSPVFAATALALVIVLTLWNLSLHNQLEQQTAAQVALNHKVLAELTRQRDAMSVMAYGSGQPRQITGTEVAARSTGRLYGKADQTTLLFVAHGLPQSQPSKTYQVWLITSTGDRTSGGTFDVDEDGYGWVLIRAPRPLNEYQGIGITEEPAGGSPKPTGPRMMTGSF